MPEFLGALSLPDCHQGELKLGVTLQELLKSSHNAGHSICDWMSVSLTGPRPPEAPAARSQRSARGESGLI